MIYLNIAIVMLTGYWLVTFDYTERRTTYIFDGMIFSWNLAEILLYVNKLLGE
jgi:hypothetical protein